MLNRREFVGAGLSAVAIGLLARRGLAAGRGPTGCAPFGGLPLPRTRPLRGVIPTLSDTVLIEGVPFSNTWSGDWPDGVPHPPIEPVANPPAPAESVDVVVVGGGLSGLTTAYLLREHNPIVLERLDRFGGAAQGEQWFDTKYSLGGAYFITPDKGTFLEALYTELGFDKVVRVDEGVNPVALNGVVEFGDFWNGVNFPDDVRQAFLDYAAIVLYYTKNYPEIPLPEGEDNSAIIALDRLTLKEDIENRLGRPAPALLAAGIQSYCYSSFGGGWEEISAAGGWNFLAAEEFGRWVLPGGNNYFVDTLWQRLSDVEARSNTCMLRAKCTVFDVRLNEGGALVTYQDSTGTLRSIQARKVVMCCPKYVAKYLIHDLDTLDNPKHESMNNLHYRPYVVANVLLKAPIALDFYDIFLLGDGMHYPMNDAEAANFNTVTDMLAGHFNAPQPRTRSVLTLYWPLCYGAARFTLVPQSAPLETYGKALVPQLDAMLKLVGLNRKAIDQVRMTRWGHAMPICAPALIADGWIEPLRRPIQDTVYFVEQDNWALPAVENSLLEAEKYTAEIAAALKR